MLFLRKLLLLNIIICFFLCGCQNKTNFTPKTNNLIFTVETDSYVFNAATDKNSNLNISIIAPENIANFKYIFKPDDVTINYLNLTKEIPLKSFEEDSVFKIIYLGFLYANKQSEFYFNNDEISLKYSVNDKDFQLFFSESGLPLKIESTDKKTEILFKGMTVTN